MPLDIAAIAVVKHFAIPQDLYSLFLRIFEARGLENQCGRLQAKVDQASAQRLDIRLDIVRAHVQILIQFRETHHVQRTFTLAQDVALTAPQGVARDHQITTVPRPQVLLHATPPKQLRRNVLGLWSELITSLPRTFKQCFDSEPRQGDPAASYSGYRVMSFARRVPLDSLHPLLDEKAFPLTDFFFHGPNFPHVNLYRGW